MFSKLIDVMNKEAMLLRGRFRFRIHQPDAAFRLRYAKAECHFKGSVRADLSKLAL